jgi:hypothetical protein
VKLYVHVDTVKMYCFNQDVLMQRIKGATQLCLLAALLESFVGLTPALAAALLAAPDALQGCVPDSSPNAASADGSPALRCQSLFPTAFPARSVVKVGVGACRLWQAAQEDALARADLRHLAVIGKPASRASSGVGG